MSEISIDDAVEFLARQEAIFRCTQACKDGKTRWMDDEAEKCAQIIDLLRKDWRAK